MNTLYKSKYLHFKYAKSPSGSDWYYVKRTNDSKIHDSAVVITTFIKKDNVYNFLFLKTKRPPIYAENKANYCLECPAGLIADENKNENLLDCTKKELLEETGYIADELFIELNNSSTSAGLSSETLTYVTAIINNDKTAKDPVNDGGIIADRILVPVNDVYSYIKSIDNKEISISSVTICGIYLAYQRLTLLGLIN